ncbi:50S ribosomal protein L18 [candidate division WWE3 bacterium RIFCSPLOWO2_01_FULL_53_14]|uniref:Large ribosomal subunit protein uL18 n=1 Tax=candidate division WWE3 bacterium RIFCSPLOWO2_01_FULL_53_14 TaxID=1802628 RepID=A0A1F4VQZ1_UNCKA|nr:MAG: 50S ribosomal protein L18 [candidate division WWE3 bacterium RIFCSPLOWO2_01_FULL_53_14]
MDGLKKELNYQRERRIKRVRSRIFGTAKRPRLSVFRSGKHTYAQLINDDKSATLVSVSDLGIKAGTKGERAAAVGKELAEKAKTAKIKAVVFDRRAYAYHGRVQMVAEAAREGGLIF